MFKNLNFYIFQACSSASNYGSIIVSYDTNSHSPDQSEAWDPIAKNAAVGRRDFDSFCMKDDNPGDPGGYSPSYAAGDHLLHKYLE